MPQAQCQICFNQLPAFPTHCPHCQREILMTTGLHFLGQILTEHLEKHSQSDPEVAKKKLTLYLKFCQRFLCDSELALLSVRTLPSGFDKRTATAIKDVISSHRQHTATLKTARRIISLDAKPEYLSVVKKIDSTARRLDNLLNTWLVSDFGGRDFGGRTFGR